jgi:hypothetical protein
MKRQVLPMMAALGCLAGLFTSSCFTQIPSGEQSSKLDASVSDDMAMRRNCAGFEAYAGTELACWDFKNRATRDAAVAWAGLQMNTTTKSCWKGVGVELQGGDGSASGACDLWLTSFVDDHRNAAASLDAQTYGSITIAVNYRTAGTPSTAIATLKVMRDSINETKLGDLTDKDSIGVL